MKFNVEIKGLCPMMQNKFDIDGFYKKEKISMKEPTEKERKDMADKLMHKNDKGLPSIPASHIEGSMRRASTQFRLAGAGKKTYKELVSGGVFIFPDLIPISGGKDWKVDARMIKMNGKGANIKYRPIFDKWSVSFEMEVNDNRAEPEMIKQILEHAGSYIGVGSYIPRFGRFEVTKFKETITK